MVRRSKFITKLSRTSKTVSTTLPRLQSPRLITLCRPGSSSEDLRIAAILNPLSQLQGALPGAIDRYVKVTKEGTKRVSTEGDAAIRVTLQDQSLGTKQAIVAYIEFKNEIGSHGDGGLQGALSLRKYMSQKHYDEIRNGSCCPTILLSLAGPWLHISGAIFVDVFTVQTLLGYIHLGGNPYVEKQIKHVAKAFEVVSRAVRSLTQYYYLLPARRELKPSLPSPTFSQNEAPHGSLVFKGPIFFEGKADKRRPLFLAEYKNTPVIVKFCESYGDLAHRTLAAKGLAPTLHFCSRVTGGAVMVIMDQVCGRDAAEEFKHSELPLTVLKDTKDALELLHREGLVFGDVRRPNIMVSRSPDKYGDDEWHGQLIDFDWSGGFGEAKYPATINDRINWAAGVQGGALICPQHDVDMLKEARGW